MLLVVLLLVVMVQRLAVSVLAGRAVVMLVSLVLGGRRGGGLVDVAALSPEYPAVVLAGDRQSGVLALVPVPVVVLSAGPLGAIRNRSLWEGR